ncbi:hypothetical protein BpHYR1_027750 [Brachionus plicatilis]|uniref:Uncharacterized protein n=1 Tax=Brachionus plicatilis TaxID=10195 RepID=A0A3M7QS39_BRAPC|nr:hypothetical protein BpHYR1_027750 [Brachionus plicatilis]
MMTINLCIRHPANAMQALMRQKTFFLVIFRLVFKSHQSYDLHKNFYQYLLHQDQLKEFFLHLVTVTLTDHIGQYCQPGIWNNYFIVHF